MMNEITKLKAWCRRVLPAVYDDSLSYYEQLARLVAKINEVIESDNELRHIVENIDGTIEQTVTDILNEWLKDGTLKEIIGNSIPFVPTGDIREDYKNDVMSCIASYLVVEYGSDCVIGTPRNIPEQVAFHYYDDKGYQGYLRTSPDTRNNSSFIYDTTQVIGGNTFHIFNTDCSSFVSLILKCRHYIESPYYYAFTTPNFDDKTMLKKCLENGDIDSKPYTLDWLNYIITYRAAYIMDSSGCTVKTLSTKKPNETPDVDMSVFSTMETGDILFFGSSKYAGTRYKGIHHCAIYIKDLADLNKFATQYGVEFKPILQPDDDTSYGFMCHVSTSTDGKSQAEGGYKNVCRIETIWSYMNRVNTGSTYSNVFTCKPYSNSLNSSKAFNVLNSRYPMQYGVFESSRYDIDIGTYWNNNGTKLNVRDIGVTGIYPDIKTIDLNDRQNGVILLENSVHTIINKPASSTAQLLTVITVGRYDSSRATQLCFDGDGFAWYRFKFEPTSWTNWFKFTVTTESN